MPPLVDWKTIIGEIAIDFVNDIFSNKSTSEKKSSKENCEDLGYAVIVDDDGDEIKNY
jgi:hypothetical protein